MGWQIDYDFEKKTGEPYCRLRRIWMTMGLLVVFLLFVSLFWPEGQDMLQILLIPGDPEKTLEAAEAFCSELNQGVSVADAARQFCITVVSDEAFAEY
ncbi:MAG: hypothetical protein IJO21_02670 [Oscillospiraceae bacterium]|nr:hypothetical protein [Oscillospiraceae bacterium]